MPNKNTFSMAPVRSMLSNEIQSDELWIDPFANNSKWAKITNDLNSEYDTNFHLDALEFLKLFDDNSVDGVLFDPPYSARQIKECYQGIGLKIKGKETTQSSFWSKLKIEIARIVKPRGKVICFGWNTQGIGITRGFEMKKILMIAHGGNHNDTLCTIELKGSSSDVMEPSGT
ncbi:hypothetical protein [Paenibacillus sp. Leaf72]|uniref:hypothetical protein n=1 Tax=Paenibacillus sp. Leaf72 TaxID=1736234 RepID=UPI000700C328|nr:hypothetical protein [Paenibacillus sp. Leaf72]KQN96959.1 adenine-specific DNA methylase [Paenibacillus sp. Leaf72]